MTVAPSEVQHAEHYVLKRRDSRKEECLTKKQTVAITIQNL
jgi:hypothetical protein